MLDELQWPTLQARRQQASLTLFYKIHNNLAIIDRYEYLSVTGGGCGGGGGGGRSRRSRSHPFQYRRPNAYTDGLKSSFFSRTIATCSKAVVPVLVLLFVALWFILRGDLLYVFPCVILFLCFSVLLVLRLPRLGKRELILVLFVRLFGLCLFRFVGFLFLLRSGKGCGL